VNTADLALERRRLPPLDELPDWIRTWTPKSRLGLTIVQAIPYLPRDLALELVDRVQSSCVVESELRVTVFRYHGLFLAGRIPWADVAIEDHGIVSRRVITDVGVGLIVDAFENLVEPELEHFHGIGTGVVAEATTDTALGTELTTEYNPNSTRATGTTSETSANIYQTVATNTLDSGTPAVTEHGVFSSATVGAGVLLDRSKFAAINLVGANGDGLQTDYRATFAAGG
jgi:hypothetical protein